MVQVWDRLVPGGVGSADCEYSAAVYAKINNDTELLDMLEEPEQTEPHPKAVVRTKKVAQVHPLAVLLSCVSFRCAALRRMH